MAVRGKYQCNGHVAVGRAPRDALTPPRVSQRPRSCCCVPLSVHLYIPKAAVIRCFIVNVVPLFTTSSKLKIRYEFYYTVKGHLVLQLIIYFFKSMKHRKTIFLERALRVLCIILIINYYLEAQSLFVGLRIRYLLSYNIYIYI